MGVTSEPGKGKHLLVHRAAPKRPACSSYVAMDTVKLRGLRALCVDDKRDESRLDSAPSCERGG
jgi:hypothetical protein